MQAARAGREVVQGFHGATGGREFLRLILGVASIFCVQRRQVIFVAAPGRMDPEHHVRLGFQRTVTEPTQRIDAALPGGQVLHHDEIGLAGKPFRASNAIKRLGHSRPERGRVFIRGKSDAVETPRQ